MYRGVARESIAPLRLRLLTARDGLAKMGECFGWDIEEGFDRPTQVLLGQLNLFYAQRRTVSFKRVLLVRGTEAQVGADENQRRAPGFAARRAQSQVDRLHIVSVLHGLRMPAIRLEAPRVVFVT